MEFIKQRILA